MRKIILLLVAAILLSSCVKEVKEKSLKKNSDDIIYQYSTKAAFLEKKYIGDLTIGELSEYGNFGLGTFNLIDGEMVFLDTVYRATVEGTIEKVDPNEMTPFASVKKFKQDTSFVVAGSISYDSLKALLLPIMELKNKPAAIRIDGEFNFVKSRSVHKQKEPFQTLAEIVKEQAVFNFENVEATGVGFWFPEYFDGVVFPAFHFHILLNDKMGGGHLLDCQLSKVKVSIDFADEVLIGL